MLLIVSREPKHRRRGVSQIRPFQGLRPRNRSWGVHNEGSSAITQWVIHPHCRWSVASPFTVLSAQSARGLSLPANVLETLSYAITTAYSYRNDFPFSTYGENLFLTIQNTLITLLIIYFPPSSRKGQDPMGKLVVASLAALASGVALYAMSTESLALLQLIPLALFSKLPQIMQNARARSTGQLSAFAVVSQIVGCLARLFTIATEVGDLIITASFVLALVLNIVLGVQMWIYWGKDGKDAYSKAPIGVVSEKEKEDWVSERQSRVDVVVTSPVPRHTASPTGRKWARKID